MTTATRIKKKTEPCPARDNLPHYWIVTGPDNGINHHFCFYCHEEKDLPELDDDRPLIKKQVKRARRNGTKPPGYYDLRKKAILADIEIHGEKRAVYEIHQIPYGTWCTLRHRWGLMKGDGRRQRLGGILIEN